jgi:hypothetical protein
MWRTRFAKPLADSRRGNRALISPPRGFGIEAVPQPSKLMTSDRSRQPAPIEYGAILKWSGEGIFNPSIGVRSSVALPIPGCSSECSVLMRPTGQIVTAIRDHADDARRQRAARL